MRFLWQLKLEPLCPKLQYPTRPYPPIRVRVYAEWQLICHQGIMYIYTCMYISIYIDIQTYVHTCTYIYIYVCTCVCQMTVDMPSRNHRVGSRLI